ncbi:hypothetical protein DDF62_15765 [Caulobacter radicis]|uniref:hypothetical protein n=1 Tax=Caulobacter radicis TaxID=2172650 RepID=UPI000D569E2E|nr:hypothetical protein [Caulobacter radicis]PVM87589.1 hypothetical protein DDF62_15765 [Caulobacter radicis]
MSATQFDHLERQLIQAHIASGQPRYSIVLKLAGGAFIRHWASERDEAMTRHLLALAEAGMISVVTFDHLTLQTLAADFPPDGKTAEQWRIECDEAIDQMFERWLAAETLH